jgi:hypothetical protein
MVSFLCNLFHLLRLPFSKAFLALWTKSPQLQGELEYNICYLWLKERLLFSVITGKLVHFCNNEVVFSITYL